MSRMLFLFYMLGVATVSLTSCGKRGNIGVIKTKPAMNDVEALKTENIDLLKEIRQYHGSSANNPGKLSPSDLFGVSGLSKDLNEEKTSNQMVLTLKGRKDNREMWIKELAGKHIIEVSQYGIVNSNRFQQYQASELSQYKYIVLKKLYEEYEKIFKDPDKYSVYVFENYSTQIKKIKSDGSVTNLTLKYIKNALKKKELSSVSAKLDFIKVIEQKRTEINDLYDLITKIKNKADIIGGAGTFEVHIQYFLKNIAIRASNSSTAISDAKERLNKIIEIQNETIPEKKINVFSNNTEKVDDLFVHNSKGAATELLSLKSMDEFKERCELHDYIVHDKNNDDYLSKMANISKAQDTEDKWKGSGGTNYKDKDFYKVRKIEILKKMIERQKKITKLVEETFVTPVFVTGVMLGKFKIPEVNIKEDQEDKDFEKIPEICQDKSNDIQKEENTIPTITKHIQNIDNAISKIKKYIKSLKKEFNVDRGTVEFTNIELSPIYDNFKNNPTKKENLFILIQRLKKRSLYMEKISNMNPKPHNGRYNPWDDKKISPGTNDLELNKINDILLRSISDIIDDINNDFDFNSKLSRIKVKECKFLKLLISRTETCTRAKGHSFFS